MTQPFSLPPGTREDFARDLYLPRLAGPDVLAQAIRDGLGLMFWQADTFAYAESYDEAAGRYRGLRGGQPISISSDSTGLVVKPDAAQRQMSAETTPVAPGGSAGGGVAGGGSVSGQSGTGGEPGGAAGGAAGGTEGTTPGGVPAPRPRRFHGTVQLDSARVGRDASRIADEVIAHLAGQVGSQVTVTLEIEATLADGASDQIVRTVTENSRTLKFTSHGFENE